MPLHDECHNKIKTLTAERDDLVEKLDITIRRYEKIIKAMEAELDSLRKKLMDLEKGGKRR